MIVIDCSYALALVMPDEERPNSMAEVQADLLFAPAVWPMEMANAFVMAVRRGRVTSDAAARMALRMDEYLVNVDVEPIAIHAGYLAAQNHALSANDAAYLELALQRRCGLATLDRRLAARAHDLGLTVFS